MSSKNRGLPPNRKPPGGVAARMLADPSPAPDPPVAAGERSPQQPPPKGQPAAGKAKLTVTVDSELVEQLRDAAVAISSETITSIVTDGISHQLDKLSDEHFNGQPIPPRKGQNPAVGRPIN